MIEDYIHIAPVVGHAVETAFLRNVKAIFDEFIKSDKIVGHIGAGRFVVAVHEHMDELQMTDFAKGLSLELLWRVLLDKKKIFLKARYQFVQYPQDGSDASSILRILSTRYYERLLQESPIHTLTEKCRQLIDGKPNVVFDEYTDVNMMQLSMTINQYRKQVEQLAYHDPAFEVGNRMKYLRDARMLISYDKKRRFSLYCIDIFSFGKYNELFNVQTGDAVLETVIGLLESLFGEYLYRINGDVFLGLSIGNSDPAEVISSIQAKLAEPFSVGGSKFTVKVNIGVCEYPMHAQTPESLLEQVQVALRHAKHSLAGSAIYNETLTELLQKESVILQRLESGIQDGTLEVWYQPIITLEDSSFFAAEALVRLRDDASGGYFPAGQVISIAERNGVVDRIGDYVLRQACSFMKSQGIALGLKRIGVNMSGQQLLIEDGIDSILSTIEETGLPPSVLSLEITETVLIQSLDRMCGELERLREQGIRIALDDFGVGYSSLNYLSRLPVDVLKIDRSLTRRITNSPEQHALLKAIVDIADANGMTVVAEGVETQEELEVVTALRVGLVQGFYFAKPMPVEKLIETLRRASHE